MSWLFYQKYHIYISPAEHNNGSQPIHIQTCTLTDKINQFIESCTKRDGNFTILIYVTKSFCFFNLRF